MCMIDLYKRIMKNNNKKLNKNKQEPSNKYFNPLGLKLKHFQRNN